MVRAWLLDAPNSPVSLNELKDIGILHWSLDADKYDVGISELNAICTERGYSNRDEITCQAGKIPREKLDTFFEEHLHEDEEIRFVLDGSGYFDARDKQDRWVRIHVEKNDLLVLPPGIYHRFSLDEKNFIRAARLFQNEPKWTPVNRGEAADATEARKEYLKCAYK